MRSGLKIHRETSCDPAQFSFFFFSGQAVAIFAEPPRLQIPEGEFIRIYTQDAETRITGRFQQAIQDSLIMTRTRGILGRKQRLSIALADISKLEVHLYHKSHAKKGGILGALAGVAGGLILIKGAEAEGPGAGLAISFSPLCSLWEAVWSVPLSAGCSVIMSGRPLTCRHPSSQKTTGNSRFACRFDFEQCLIRLAAAY